MECAKISVSFTYVHIGLIPQVFLRRSHVMLLEMCLCVVIFKTCFFNAQPHFTRNFTNTFCVTPLALHTRHLSCISDGIGQCLLLQTSSLAKCDSMLGGLPNGLGTLRPAYSSLGYIENLYVTFSYPHTRNEECSH